MVKRGNVDKLKDLYDAILDNEDPILDNDISPVAESKEEITTGGSLRPSEESIHSKYFIDRHKLNNNVLELR